MVKKLFIALFAVLVIFSPMAQAAESVIYDNARIISSSNYGAISSRIDEIKTKYQVPVIIYTTEENVYNVRDRSDNLLADYVGNDKDGLILYINMNIGDYHIAFSGRVLHMIDDNRLEDLKSSLLDKLVSGDYDGAINHFLAQAEGYIAGGEIAGNQLIEENTLTPQDTATAGAGGLMTFLMSYFGLKKGSSPKPSGLIYSVIDNTKSSLSASNDKFITTRTTSRIIPRVVVTSGSKRGGSFTTTHRGSSGGTFGGGGGKFK